jgi:hypothetical protein
LTCISRIRWNGLFIDVPERWEVIVKDTRHLILEKDLTPLLEIRWQPGAEGGSSRKKNKIAARFGKDVGYSPSVQIGEVLSRLKERYEVQGFTPNHAPGTSAVMLVCRQCAATILIRIYPGALESLETDSFVLDSLLCHADDRDQQNWQIQDFFFQVPEAFWLTSCSFRFGLTSLFFSSKAADLSFCRLAPASEHLKNSGLAALFESLCSAPLQEQMAVDPLTLRFCRWPGGVKRVWSSLRRKKVFRAAALTHFPDNDRIVGYTLRSRRPIGPDLQTSIENGYGIVQKKETTVCPDPGPGPGLHAGQE